MIVKATDLKKLENVYSMSGNQLVFMYGRLDSEKEELIKQFISDKKYFYYRCRQASEKEQCAMMGEEVKRQFDVHLNETSYREFFNRVKSNGPEKLVVVIDEAENVIKKDASFWDAILELKAHKLYPGPVMIVLMSSSLVWSNNVIMAEDSAYRKSFDAVIKLEDLSFLDLVRAFPDYSVSEAVALYGVLGGVPGFLNEWNGKKSFKQNICELVLSKNGALFDKAQQMISNELRELSVYNTILSTIAAEKNKLNDLYLETGFSRAKISVYMKNLAAFDIVKKHLSFETGGWDNAKKGVYQISDTFVNFWYRFVYPNLSDLYLLSPEAFYDRYIAKELDVYLNRYFIEVCKEYLSLLNQMNRLPIPVTKMASWIGKTGNIDILAQSSDRRNIVGSCNWTNSAMTLEMFAQLSKTMELAKVSSDHIFLFSATTFAEDLVEYAQKDSRIELVDMREL